MGYIYASLYDANSVTKDKRKKIKIAHTIYP